MEILNEPEIQTMDFNHGDIAIIKAHGTWKEVLTFGRSGRRRFLETVWHYKIM